MNPNSHRTTDMIEELRCTLSTIAGLAKSPDSRALHEIYCAAEAGVERLKAIKADESYGPAEVEVGDSLVESHVRAMNVSRNAALEEAAAICDQWEAFTANERNGKRGTAAMLARDIRELKQPQSSSATPDSTKEKA